MIGWYWLIPAVLVSFWAGYIARALLENAIARLERDNDWLT